MVNQAETVHARQIRWSDLTPDTPMPLLERQRIIGSQAMLSRILLRKGCDVPRHQHPNEQFACVLSGRMRFGLGEPGTPGFREVTLTGGEVLHLPGGVAHSAVAIEDSEVLDVFSPPSATTGIDRK